MIPFAIESAHAGLSHVEHDHSVAAEIDSPRKHKFARAGSLASEGAEELATRGVDFDELVAGVDHVDGAIRGDGDATHAIERVVLGTVG
jgi:hypothetical protein